MDTDKKKLRNSKKKMNKLKNTKRQTKKRVSKPPPYLPPEGQFPIHKGTVLIALQIMKANDEGKQEMRKR